MLFIGPGVWLDADRLARFRKMTRGHPTESVWLFGSALRRGNPRDIDILIMYEDPMALAQLKSAVRREFPGPPCDIIALTPQEEAFYDFRHGVNAVQLA